MYMNSEIARILAQTRIDEAETRNAYREAVRIASLPHDDHDGILRRYVIRPASRLHLAGPTS
jgi:hypothetical protein